MLQLFQIDCVAENELTARINMADAKFSFQEKGKLLNIYIVKELYHKAYLYFYHQSTLLGKNYHPQWMAPEALQKSPKTINVKAADMWSFAVLLWELSAREVPFADLSPMEAGMKVCLCFKCITNS